VSSLIILQFFITFFAVIIIKYLLSLQTAASQNNFNIQRAFLILTAIAISTAATANSNFNPNRQHQQIALCIQIIVQQHFTKGRTVLVSMPSEDKRTGRYLSASQYHNNRALVSFTLARLHENISWPLRLFPPKIPLDAGVETTHSYIIFTRPGNDDDIMQNLRDQIQTLKETEGASWNPRGKFLVLVPESDDVSTREIGLQIYEEMWKEHFAIDTKILVAVHDIYVPINDKNYTIGLRKDTLDLYTGFPYERGGCGDITDVTLLDQWQLSNGTFVHNGNLFPLKTPEKFHGCQIRVASLGIPPYSIVTGKSTDSEGNVVYKLGGLSVQNLLLAVDNMNVTAVFLKSSARFELLDSVNAIGYLFDRSSDIVIGTIPLLPVYLSLWTQPTGAVKWFLPCPQPVARMEKVMNTYQIPVWLTLSSF
jgi:hypothetical protein